MQLVGACVSTMCYTMCNDTRYADTHSSIEAIAMELGFTLRNVPGDGHCLFYGCALSFYLFRGTSPNEELGRTIRRYLFGFLCKNRESNPVVKDLMNLPEQYLYVGDRVLHRSFTEEGWRTFLESNSYGDQWDICLMEEAFEISIIIYSVECIHGDGGRRYRFIGENPVYTIARARQRIVEARLRGHNLNPCFLLYSGNHYDSLTPQRPVLDLLK